MEILLRQFKSVFIFILFLVSGLIVFSFSKTMEKEIEQTHSTANTNTKEEVFFSRQVFRGEHLGMADTREDDILVPLGMFPDGGLRPGCVLKPEEHVMGKNNSIWLSTTLSFHKAFGWATEAEGVDGKQDGVVWIINANTTPMSRIWNTMTMLGDPFKEKEILIKGIISNAIPFSVYRYESSQTAYNRAIMRGLINPGYGK